MIIVFYPCSLWKQTRPAAIAALNMVDLSGRNGIVSESSPGIFLQVGGKYVFMENTLVRKKLS